MKEEGCLREFALYASIATIYIIGSIPLAYLVVYITIMGLTYGIGFATILDAIIGPSILLSLALNWLLLLRLPLHSWLGALPRKRTLTLAAAIHFAGFLPLFLLGFHEGLTLGIVPASILYLTSLTMKPWGFRWS